MSKLLSNQWDPITFFVAPFQKGHERWKGSTIDIKDWWSLATNPKAMFAGAGAGHLGYEPGANPNIGQALMHVIKANGPIVLAASVGAKAGEKFLRRMGLNRNLNKLFKMAGIRSEVKA